MQREDVGAGEEFVEGAGAFDADGFVDAVGEIGVVEKDVEAERFGAEGGGGADAAKADNAEGEFAQTAEFRFDADDPAEFFCLLIEGEELAAEGEGERDGVVGDFLSAVVGDVADGDAVPAGGGDVYGIEADAITNEGATLAQARDAGFADGRVVPDDEGIGVADLVGEIGVAAAQIAADFGGVADDAALDSGLGFSEGGFRPVDDADEGFLRGHGVREGWEPTMQVVAVFRG